MANKKEVKFQPIGKRILVESDPDIKTGSSDSKLILPDDVIVHSNEGVVVAVGSVVTDVKVGDRVRFTRHSFMPLKIGGFEYLIMSELDILGVL